MLYLLDANVLIDAARDYYPLDRVPEFWSWLVQMGKQGQVKVPIEIYDEVMKKNDDLKYWLQENKDVLLFDELVSQPLVAEVTELGYGPCLTDVEIEKIGGSGDPFLIAYARVDPEHRCVVTTEHSRPTRTRANRHIPDVCKGLGIECIGTFDLIRRLDFRTQDFRTSR